MKKIFLILPLLALAACGTGAFDKGNHFTFGGDGKLADGREITQSQAETDHFESIASIGPDNIIFQTSDKFTISATGDNDVLAKLRYIVDDGELIVGREKGFRMGGKHEKAIITITAPALSGLTIAGSGDVSADKLSGVEVNVDIAGSGTINIANIQTEKLDTSIAGSGNVVIAGVATKSDYSIAGSGNIDAGKLTSTDADVSIAGSGDIKLSASNQVDASIAGSGDIYVSGGAKCTSSSIGSGKLHCS